ncbi:MAG: PEP-CTERM sorting domain-containing protein [Akkermansia sp.]|nr:PEP-CTERM sorting domain-containing protein [Akkermansia sp.]
MKKTLFITMLAAALVGGQVFAADAIPTAVEGATQSGNSYYGKRNASGEAKDANVTVSASETGSDMSRANVYGGYASTEASNNKITMTGGQVKNLHGADGTTTVSGNTVIMTGGKVTSNLYSGASYENEALVEKNVAIVAGDCEISSCLCGGYSSHGDVKDNKVYLVGKGATATIADAQGITSTYNGGNISLKWVYAGDGEGTLANNSIDIYGTGITASSYVEKMQILNFHISQNQIGGEYANASMLTLTKYGMDLTDVTIGIQDVNVDVQAWTPGTTVTLVQATKVIKGIESGKEVDIKRDDKVVAKGQLVLSNDDKTLSLSIPGSVPEPTTGTLGLLALAGLCARRRRK